MRHAILIAGVLMAALLLGGCAPEGDQATGKAIHTGNATGTIGGEAAPEKVVHEIRKDGDEFIPEVIHADVGQTVELAFLLDEPHHIAIEGLGMTDHVQHDTVGFVAPQEGEYPVVCLDCEKGATTMLVVE